MWGTEGWILRGSRINSLWSLEVAGEGVAERRLELGCTLKKRQDLDRRKRFL